MTNLEKASLLIFSLVGGTFNLHTLTGDRNKHARQQILSILVDRNVPIKDCGINAIKNKLIGMLCIQYSCNADADKQIADKLREIVKNCQS